MRDRIAVVCLSLLALGGCLKAQEQTDPTMLYLGQATPGTSPEVFAPGIVSTGMHEFDIAITPDGREIYYTTFINGLCVIVTSRFEDGRWTSPEVAPFSGRYSDQAPFIHPDGSRMFFVSNRPLDAQAELSESMNIWVMERSGREWGDPEPIGQPVNGSGYLAGPAVTADGTLYFTRRSAQGWEGIFRSRYIEGKYTAPEKLPLDVQFVEPGHLHGHLDMKLAQPRVYVAPDESFIIFPAAGRADTIGRSDYYISFRDRHDNWSAPAHLGDEMNTRQIETSPYLSPDGRYFFFQSSPFPFEMYEDREVALTYSDLENRFHNPGNGNMDIYWVDAEFIKGMRPRNPE